MSDSKALTDRIDVHYVARLARLELKPQECAEFQAQLEQIVGYFNILRAVDVEGVEPTAHAVAVHNVFREDEVRPGLDRETALANAPEHAQGQFKVPLIVE